MEVQEVAEQPRSQRWRIAKERRTYAGIATELVGLTLHAESKEKAIEHAAKLFPWLSGKLVALPEVA